MTDNSLIQYNGASNSELLEALKGLHRRLQFYENRMLNKTEVAEMLGMSISWLDNSQSNKARKLRQIGVRYGRSHASPVRFPLIKVAPICFEVE